MSEPFIEIYSTIVGKSLGSSYLSQAEEQIARERKQSQEYRFIRNWVRICLGQSLGVNPVKLEFDAGAHGKPYLKGVPLWFNLSHSKDVAYLAVSSFAEVGLDIETIHTRSNYLQLAKRFFHKNEIKVLEEMDTNSGERLFLKLWTIKEALVKESGVGIGNKLNSIDALDFMQHPANWSFEDKKLQLYHKQRESVLLSLVWRGSADMKIIDVKS